MDFQELLTKRRAIRDFQDKPVPLSVVKEIIQDTVLAPTASNGQPCKFIIVQDRAVMKKLSDESKANFLADIVRTPSTPLKMYEETLRNAAFNAFYNAPCMVYVIGPRSVRSLDLDTALTVAYFMFSATARGLGTCWVALGANIRNPETFKELAIPDGFRIVAPVILGYPAAIPAASERHAPDIVKIIPSSS
jgi:nitroreductase